MNKSGKVLGWGGLWQKDGVSIQPRTHAAKQRGLLRRKQQQRTLEFDLFQECWHGAAAMGLDFKSEETHLLVRGLLLYKLGPSPLGLCLHLTLPFHLSHTC